LETRLCFVGVFILGAPSEAARETANTADSLDDEVEESLEEEQVPLQGDTDQVEHDHPEPLMQLKQDH